MKLKIIYISDSVIINNVLIIKPILHAVFLNSQKSNSTIALAKIESNGIPNLAL